ncbi:hypothetical protein ABIF66_011208 [Bradyrhizobium japonicum]
MCRPSRLILEGRSCVVTIREPGLRWTRQRWAREVRAGRIALREPKTSCRMSGAARFVSSVSFRLRRQGWKNCGDMAGRAYGKTVWSSPPAISSVCCEQARAKGAKGGCIEARQVAPARRQGRRKGRRDQRRLTGSTATGPRQRHVKLGPIRARQVRAGLSSIRKQSEYAYVFRYLRRFPWCAPRSRP